MSTASGDPELFQREGSAYLLRYPAFSWWAYAFYAGIFPVTTVLVTARLLTIECTSKGRFHPLFDGFMWIGVVVSFFLYRLWPIIAKKVRRKASGPPS